VLSCIGLLAAACAQPAAAQYRTTMLLSRSYDDGLPNGESRNGSISRDQRIGRIAAFESDASNIVRVDNNRATDVFMVRRKRGWGHNGTIWRRGATTLISRGIGGAPANGRSYAPAVSGAGSAKPRCIAFLSDASNLVAGDNNGVADAFVYNIHRRTIRRVSVASNGEQANAATTEVVVDGRCRRVAFVSRATNLAYRGGGRSTWRTARTTASSGQSQVYVRAVAGSFRGLTFLASASAKRRAGNGDSSEVAFARFGHFVAFTSTATNLSGRDRDAGTDVYRRAFKPGKRLRFSTLLVSQRGGRRGNGPSSRPSINEYGRYVAFQTQASNLLAGDRNGVSDIVQRDIARRRNSWVSRSTSGIGNASSVEPEITGGGIFVFFASRATNLRPAPSIKPVSNGVQNVMMWNRNTRRVAVEARDHRRRYLDASASGISSSLRGNYVLFQSAATLVDRVVRNHTGRQQVYLLYMGPK
jgi:hypothetical protein